MFGSVFPSARTLNLIFNTVAVVKHLALFLSLSNELNALSCPWKYICARCIADNNKLSLSRTHMAHAHIRTDTNLCNHFARLMCVRACDFALFRAECRLAQSHLLVVVVAVVVFRLSAFLGVVKNSVFIKVTSCRSYKTTNTFIYSTVSVE